MTSEYTENGWTTYGDWSEGKYLELGPWTMGLGQPSPETAPFWDGVARHELLLPRCRHCRAWHHPRRIVCYHCDDTAFAWSPASGDGVVYSVTTVHRNLTPFPIDVPYELGVVQLAEGIHLLTRFFSTDDSPVTIDDPVNVQFRDLEVGFTLPVFVKTKGSI